MPINVICVFNKVEMLLQAIAFSVLYASETVGASIYYTVNGKNPAPFEKHSVEAKSTMKYMQPFRLAGGKRTVKALAVAQ